MRLPMTPLFISNLYSILLTSIILFVTTILGVYARVCELLIYLFPVGYLFEKKGLLLWEKGGESEKEKAAEHFVISAKLNPQNSAAFKYLGHYYAQVSVDTKRALKCYQRAVSLNPDDSHAGVHCSSFHFLYNTCSVSFPS